MLITCLLNLVKCIILQVAPFLGLCTCGFCERRLQYCDMREVVADIVNTSEELLKLLFASGYGEIGNMRYVFFCWYNPIYFDCQTQNFDIVNQEVALIHPEIEVVFFEFFEYLPKVTQVIIICVSEY